MKIDLSLKNSELYKGCCINEVGGRLNLTTKPDEASNRIGRNIRDIIDGVPVEDRDEAVLTGAMAVWAYLVVFHAVVHAFNRVVYEDGRNNRVVIAAHG